MTKNKPVKNIDDAFRLRCSPKIGQVIKFEGKGEHRNGKEKEIHIRIQGKSGI